MHTLNFSSRFMFSCYLAVQAVQARCLFYLVGRVLPLPGGAKREQIKPVTVVLSHIRKSTFISSAPAGMPKSKQGGTPKKGGGGGTSRGQKYGGASKGTNKSSLFQTKLSPPFEQYWDKERVQNGLKRGTLCQGKINISSVKFNLAFVSNPSGGPDFMLEGLCARNRALQGDVVVVEVLEEVSAANVSTSSSASNSSPEEHLNISSLTISDGHTSTPLATQTATPPSTETTAPLSSDTNSTPPPSDTPSSIPSATPPSVCDDRPPLGETLIDRLYRKSGMELGESIREKIAMEKQRKAKVVYITDKVHNRACVGTLKAFDMNMNLALLSPRDSRIPRVCVPLKELPEDYPRDFKKYELTTFVCSIKDWGVDDPFAAGHVMRSLGEAGLVEVETEALLVDNDIDSADFSEEVNACLPKEKPWTIPQEEVKKRRDFRGECVFSVDPETARDLDDALHIKKLSEDKYEVGVHIADVSYFVKPGTALDSVASKRATSTYLVHKVIPMLPRLLCENLCSLNPNEDKLSFSVVWQLTSKGEFLSQWMGRSIIRSCCKLSYGHAQNMIDGECNFDYLPPISGGFLAPQVMDAVVTLNNLAKALRKQRQSKGTLRLDQPKLHYILNDTTGMPYGCEVYPIGESNRMIEEFMLMANMSIARRISDTFPEGAMLRRHPPPKQVSIEELVKRCAVLGLKLDISTASSIQQSLEQYVSERRAHSKVVDLENLAFVIMCVKVMEFALYFSCGTKEYVSPHHYALNVPLYTHFTSPIRRYADIVVHRQLAHALGEGPEFTTSPEDVELQAIQCNKKKKDAKKVGDSSVDMFFSILLKEGGPQTCEAVVVSVQNKYFDVLLKRYKLTKTVYYNQLENLKSFEVASGEGQVPELKLVWNISKGEETLEQLQTVKVFSEIDVTLSSMLPKDSYKTKAVIKPPSPAP